MHKIEIKQKKITQNITDEYIMRKHFANCCRDSQAEDFMTIFKITKQHRRCLKQS